MTNTHKVEYSLDGGKTWSFSNHAMSEDEALRFAKAELSNRRLAVTDNHRLVHILAPIGERGFVVVEPMTFPPYVVHCTRLTLVPDSDLMVSELRFT